MWSPSWSDSEDENAADWWPIGMWSSVMPLFYGMRSWQHPPRPRHSAQARTIRPSDNWNSSQRRCPAPLCLCHVQRAERNPGSSSERSLIRTGQLERPGGRHKALVQGFGKKNARFKLLIHCEERDNHKLRRWPPYQHPRRFDNRSISPRRGP